MEGVGFGQTLFAEILQKIEKSRDIKALHRGVEPVLGADCSNHACGSAL
jgi:hypothetical protein